MKSQNLCVSYESPKRNASSSLLSLAELELVIQGHLRKEGLFPGLLGTVICLKVPDKSSCRKERFV